jgi:hypothetical protein
VEEIAIESKKRCKTLVFVNTFHALSKLVLYGNFKMKKSKLQLYPQSASMCG